MRDSSVRWTRKEILNVETARRWKAVAAFLDPSRLVGEGMRPSIFSRWAADERERAWDRAQSRARGADVCSFPHFCEQRGNQNLQRDRKMRICSARVCGYGIDGHHFDVADVVAT